MPETKIADVRSEGETLDIETLAEERNEGEETPSESQPEKKPAEAKAEEGAEGAKKPEDTDPDANLPFHEHPRWKKMQNELKEARANGENVEALKNRIAELETSIRGEKPVELPKWWADAYGNDEKSSTAYKNYLAATQAERERIVEEVTQKLQGDTERQAKEAKAGEEYVETQLSEMESEGVKFDRNVLLKFMVDFQNEYGAGSLLDAEGSYDFRKSLTLMQKMNPTPADESVETRKKIAGDVMRSKGRPAQNSSIPVVDSRVLRRGSWRDADKK